MKNKTPLHLIGTLAVLSLCSCADVDTAGGPGTTQHHKPQYAAAYDDTGRELAWSAFQLVWTDPDYLSLESRSKQFAYISQQAHNLGVPEWRVVSPGNWQIDDKQLKAMPINVNKLPPDVKQVGVECVQFGSDVLSDQAMKDHNGLATAYDQAGAREAGGEVLGILGGLAGVAGGGSGVQVANAVAPVGADAAINALSSQSDIATAMANSSLALQQKYGAEHDKMKAALAALIQKYGAQYPDLVTATAPPVRRAAFITPPSSSKR